MQKPVIAIDIDEVLSPFVPEFVVWHNQHYGTEYRLEDFHTYEFYKVWGGSREEAIIKGCDYFETRGAVEPLADSVAVLNRLRHHYDLMVITSRMLTQKAKTEAWIAEHFPGIFQEIVLCNHWSKNSHEPMMKKSEACLLHGAQYLIDDLPSYVEDAATAGIQGLLFGQYPWNQQVLAHPQIQRVADWRAIESLLNPQ